MNCLEGKYKNWYFSIINECRESPPISDYTEKHHIIPRSIGGDDSESNLVSLTAKQHFICHLLLTKMFREGTFEYYKMLHAFCMMIWCSSKEQQRYTSRCYQIQRKEFSSYMKLKQIGRGNNQYGTVWIYNENLKECKKIPKGEELQDGWEYGRVMNWNTFLNQKAKREKREKIVSSRKCRGCSQPLPESRNTRTAFCSIKCSNQYRYKDAKMITLYKDGKVKIVKVNNAPAYKKSGWHTGRNSNPQPSH